MLGTEVRSLCKHITPKRPTWPQPDAAGRPCWCHAVTAKSLLQTGPFPSPHQRCFPACVSMLHRHGAPVLSRVEGWNGGIRAAEWSHLGTQRGEASLKPPRQQGRPWARTPVNNPWRGGDRAIRGRRPDCSSLFNELIVAFHSAFKGPGIPYRNSEHVKLLSVSCH